MKKIAGRAAAMAMAVVMMSGASGAAVFAAEEAKTQDKETKVKYSSTAEYEWTVPSEIIFVEGNQKDGKIKNESGKLEVLKNKIENNYKVKFTVKGSGESNAFTIKDDSANDTLTYTICKKDETTPIAVNGEVLSLEAGHTGSQVLVFELNLGEYIKAGTYTGIATFTATAEDKSSQSD